MRSRPDTTNISVQPRRRSSGGLVAGAVIAMLALGALVVAGLYMTPSQEAPSVGASPTATATPTETVAGSTATPATPAPTAAAPTTTAPSGQVQTYQSPLGYSVDVPAGWRRSDLQSQTAPIPQGDPEVLARDVFTNRTPDDESRAKDNTHVGFSGLYSYTAFVRIYRNTEGLTPRRFAEERAGEFGLKIESIEDITFADRGRTSGGKPAARVTWSWDARGTSFATFVEDDQDRMWEIGFYLALRDEDVPAGATREDLLKIVGTFSAPWLRD